MTKHHFFIVIFEKVTSIRKDPGRNYRNIIQFAAQSLNGPWSFGGRIVSNKTCLPGEVSGQAVQLERKIEGMDSNATGLKNLSVANNNESGVPEVDGNQIPLF